MSTLKCVTYNDFVLHKALMWGGCVSYAVLFVNLMRCVSKMMVSYIVCFVHVMMSETGKP